MSSCPQCFSGTPLWQLYDVTEGNPEFCLYSSVVSEFTDIAGFPVLYYRAKSKLDRLFGEDANQDYYEPLKTKLIYEPSEEPNIIDGFGIRSDETLQYASIPKALFARDVGLGSTTLQPMAGDVIKTLWNNRNYEIVDIGAEQNIFMAKKLIWEFILRPFRFSEQSAKAEEIHRSSIGWKIIWLYPYPDLGYADVTYPDGTQDIKVPTDPLNIDISTLTCGYKYKVAADGSITIYEEMLVTEDDITPHPTYENTGLPLENKEVTMLGDNDYIEIQSDDIDDYGDVDNILFASTPYNVMLYGVANNTTIVQIDIDSFMQLGILDEQTQDVTYTPNDEYLYLVTPFLYNEFTISVGGFVTPFIVSEGEFVINNEVTKVYVYRSQYKQTSDSITISVSNTSRKSVSNSYVGISQAGINIDFDIA